MRHIGWQINRGVQIGGGIVAGCAANDVARFVGGLTITDAETRFHRSALHPGRPRVHAGALYIKVLKGHSTAATRKIILFEQSNGNRCVVWRIEIRHRFPTLIEAARNVVVSFRAHAGTLVQ